MNELFQKNGILLAPSRFDTQGVTVGEAAMSGLAIIASKNTGVSDMLNENLGTFFNNNNLSEAVQIIDDIYNEKNKLSELSKKTHENISKTASKKLIDEEIKLLKSKPLQKNRFNIQENNKSKKDKIILSVAIPSYNAAQYLTNGVKSLINQKYFKNLEIIIINDGSSDNTLKVMQQIREKIPNKYRDNIVLIDKKNGGHGSTINASLKIARGKYFRVMDADDRLDSYSLEKHIEFLLNTDVDIVFTNTIHDLSIKSILKPDHKYDFMTEYQPYFFDDLCEEFYGFSGYGPVLSTTSTKTENLRNIKCHLTENSFYVDIEYNYFMTEASNTAALDPVELYYYYLGRSGQSLAKESYMKNFYQHLNVLDNLMKLLEQNKLSEAKRAHFIRVQLHETIFHQYRIGLEMFNSYTKFKEIEKVIKKYKNFYHDEYLIPNYVKRMRKFGLVYFIVRKIKRKLFKKAS